MRKFKVPDAVFLRIDFANGGRIGPGKIALLDAIARIGSISGAARDLGMGYRTAWLLVDSLNTMFVEPVVVTAPGRKDGASTLTDLGRSLIAAFRRMEALTEDAVEPELKVLRRKLK